MKQQLTFCISTSEPAVDICTFGIGLAQQELRLVQADRSPQSTVRINSRPQIASMVSGKLKLQLSIHEIDNSPCI